MQGHDDLRQRVVSTHSRPKAAGMFSLMALDFCLEFQHTAARRRLVEQENKLLDVVNVSTHSRPKAAGRDE